MMAFDAVLIICDESAIQIAKVVCHFMNHT